MTDPRRWFSGEIRGSSSLLVLVVLSSAPFACARPHACAGADSRCAPAEQLSARARCESPSGGAVCACGAMDWGSTCSKHVDCKCGLECVDSTCETSMPICESQ